MNWPKCPYCKCEFDAEDINYSGSTDFPTKNDGDEAYTKCHDCGKELIIVLELTPSWKFIDEDGEEI